MEESKDVGDDEGADEGGSYGDSSDVGDAATSRGVLGSGLDLSRDLPLLGVA
jgi:hypothetical protein